METEKLQSPIKIIKKHLKTNNFDSDVYILNYQVSFLNIKIWREFPIYFYREDILKDHNTMVTRTRQYDKEHNLTSLYREKMTQIYPGDFQRHKQYTLYDFKNKKYDDLYMGYFRNGQQEYLKESGELIAVDSKAAKSANNVISGHKIKITHSEKHGI